MTSYQPSIPTGTVPFNEDYQNIQNNFSQLNTTYGVDHVAYNVALNNGYHKSVHLVPVSTIASNPPNNQPINGYTATGGIGQILNAQINDGINMDEALYFLTGGNRLIQLTRNFVPVASTNGYTMLIGGLILQWGTSTKTTGGSTSFPIAFPANCFGVLCTVFENNSNRHFVFVQTKSLSAFTVASRDSGGNDESNTFFWAAIGN